VSNLDAIRKRLKRAEKGNPLRSTTVLANYNQLIFEDVPELLSTITRYKNALEEIAEETGTPYGSLADKALKGGD
jgi:hypothetical protein